VSRMSTDTGRRTQLPGARRLLLTKMWRDLIHQRGQFAAVVVVLLFGTAVFGSMYVAFQNLNLATSEFYAQHRFADFTVAIHPTSESVLRGLEELRGVDTVNGRVSVDVPLDTPSAERRITGRLIGVPVPDRDTINDISVMSGSYLHSSLAHQALIQPETEFFNAHGLELGDVLKPLIQGRQHELTVTGIVNTPEYVIPVRSELDMLTPSTEFLVLFVPEKWLSNQLGYQGEINEVLFQFEPGLSDLEREELQDRIEDELDPYGVIAAVPRKDQLSNAMLDSEMSMLEGIANSMPVFFYLAAAIVLYSLLLRLIEGQRVQVGVLRSLGYRRRDIFAHYLAFAVVVSIIGTVLGAIMGWSAAGYITNLYASFFNIPVLSMHLHLDIILVAFALSLTFSLVAAYIAIRNTLRETPAELLRRGGVESAQTPGWYSRVALWVRSASLSVRLAIRNIIRSPRRSLMTIVVIASSVTLMFACFFFIDAADHMLKTSFGEQQKFDLKVAYGGVISETELITVLHDAHVREAEPLFELPVKLKHGRHEEAVVLNGLRPDTEMLQLFDEDGNRVRLPAAGLVFDETIMEKLGVTPGDELVLETVTEPKEEYVVHISGEINQMIGANAYMNIGAMQRMLGSGPVMTASYLAVDKGTSDIVRDELLDMPGIQYALAPGSMEQVMEDYMVLFWAMMVLFVVLSGSLALAIVYNTTQMNIMERRQEIASMRVLGLRAAQVGRMILYENLAMAVIGYFVGLPLGTNMAKALVDTAASDLYHLPAVIYPRTYVVIALLTLGFVALAYLPGVRNIRNMSLVEVIKVHES